MNTLVEIAGKKFQLPKNREVREFQGRPHTIAVTDASKVDRRDNPFGVIGSLDVRAHRTHLDRAIAKLLTDNGAKPVGP